MGLWSIFWWEVSWPPRGSVVMLMDTVTEAYLAFAIMTLVGIGFPVGAFIASYFLRPIEDPNDKTNDIARNSYNSRQVPSYPFFYHSSLRYDDPPRRPQSSPSLTPTRLPSAATGSLLCTGARGV